jgi:hypothetical protein
MGDTARKIPENISKYQKKHIISLERLLYAKIYLRSSRSF